MLNPFRPMTGRASFNAVRIIDIPGADIDPDVRGRTVYELISARALTLLIRQQAVRLGLRPERNDLPILLEDCFSSPNPAVRSAAVDVARRYGQRLGAALLALRRGDAINRAARADWEAAHWRYWGAIEQVWIGGGLVDGRLGPLAAEEAEAVLAANGFPDYQVHLSPYGAHLALLGAARRIASHNRPGRVFDFGNSFVKRGYVTFRADVLTALHGLPRVQSSCGDYVRGEWSRVFAQRLANSMAVIMAATRAEVMAQGVSLHPTIGACLACYMQNGQPEHEDRGCYNSLGMLSDNLADFLASQVSARSGAAYELTLLHDASAAALVYAGQPNSAVLTLGTAAGIGFPPPTTEGLQPLAEPVAIMDHGIFD
jgi:hypothetical protein